VPRASCANTKVSWASSYGSMSRIHPFAARRPATRQVRQGSPSLATRYRRREPAMDHTAGLDRQRSIYGGKRRHIAMMWIRFPP
jgi:hypothetical protein